LTTITASTRSAYRTAISAFHDWLTRKRIKCTRLKPSHIKAFDDFIQKKTWVGDSYKKSHKYKTAAYLEWLYIHGHLSFDPGYRRIRRTTLPDIAEDFLRTLTTLKDSSRGNYRASLLNFHGWLDEEQLSVSQLQRDHMIGWFNHLNDRGMAATTRIHCIVKIRVYLRWLDEHGLLNAPVDNLIRTATDVPRRPTYLPRPLPPEADRQLQLRLEESDSPYQQALLVMRKTGMRLGELLSLEFDCVRKDHRGNRFVKVPLGKLENERLVPIDEQTFRLIEKLQGTGRKKRRRLLEDKKGKPVRQDVMRQAVRQACEGLEIPGNMHSHRLRHTYATSLLNAGMSLVSVMKLLGHRDQRMTLRYAAITQDTVVKEYYEALSQLQRKYTEPLHTRKSENPDPQKMLSDVVRWLQKTVDPQHPNRNVALRLIKRIKRIQTAIHHLDPEMPQ
jgi:site-specific recombinase XerD